MFQIDSTMWVLALPVAFMLGHVGLMSSEHPIRSRLAQLAEIESRAMTRVFGRSLDSGWLGAYWVLTAALALSGLLSFGAWLGWVS